MPSSVSMSLPEPLTQGDLARTPFAHVLMRLHERALTGSLVLWNPEVPEGKPQQDRIRFLDGNPVAAVLLEPASRLDRGLLPLFSRTEGPYAFYGDTDMVGDSPHVRTGSVEPLHLIAASLRGSCRDDAVDHVLAGLGDHKLRLVVGVDLKAFGFLPMERGCVDLLRAEPMPLAELCEISPLDKKLVRRLVYLLALAKSVEPWDGKVEKIERPRSPPRSTSEERQSQTAASIPAMALPPKAGLSTEHARFWRETTDKAAEIETQNYFEMLGVARDLAGDAIQTAYFALVKKWHPDRLPAEIRELKPQVEQIFMYLTRAQETLCDEHKRGPYLATVQDGGGTPEAERELASIVQAAMDFRKVEVMTRRREWDKALELLDEIIAVSGDDANYHATRAHVLFQKGGDDTVTASAISASLDRAIALSENHDKAHLYYGLFHKRAGRPEKAQHHFEIAARVNPKNIEAVREVRIATMRTGGGSEKGFFDKLFKGKKK